MSAHRLKAFIDAVVAIAMTLLIFPLLDSVANSGDQHVLTAQWTADHGLQIFSFLLSFVLIAEAWRDHHRLFDLVESVTHELVWLSVLWMLTVVWLPVPTAMLGSLQPDAVQKLLYIGTLLAMRLIMLLSRIHLSRHRELHQIAAVSLRSGTVANAIMVGLLVLILIVAIAIHDGLGYFALISLALVTPIHAIVWRRVQRR